MKCSNSNHLDISTNSSSSNGSCGYNSNTRNASRYCSSERFQQQQQRLPPTAVATTTTTTTTTNNNNNNTASNHSHSIRNQNNLIQNNIRVMKIAQRLRYQFILLVFLVITYLLFNMNSMYYPSIQLLLSSSSSSSSSSFSSFILLDNDSYSAQQQQQQKLNSFNDDNDVSIQLRLQLLLLELDNIIDQVGGLHREQIQHIISHIQQSRLLSTITTTETNTGSSSSSSSSSGEETGGTNLLIWLGTHHFNTSPSPSSSHHYNYQQQQQQQQQQKNQSHLIFLEDIIDYWHRVITTFTSDGIVVMMIECEHQNTNSNDTTDNYYDYYYRRIQERYTNVYIYMVQMQNVVRKRRSILEDDLNHPTNEWTLNLTAIDTKRPNHRTLLETTIFDVIIIDHTESGHPVVTTTSTTVDLIPSIYNTTYEIIQNSFHIMVPLVRRPQQHVTVRQPYPIHVFVIIDKEDISTNLDKVFPNIFFDRTPIRIIPSVSNDELILFNQSILSSQQQPQTIHQNMTIIHHHDLAHYVFYHNDHTLFRSKPVLIHPTIMERENEQEEISNTAMIQKELTDNIIHLRHTTYMRSASKLFYPRSQDSSVIVLQSNITTTNTTTTAPEEDVSSVPVLLMIDAPIYIHHHHKNIPAKPFMAVITSALSTKEDRIKNDVYQTFLFQHLISSIIRTVTESEQEYWMIQLFVAIDDTDLFWMKHWNEIENIPNWLQLSFVTFPDRGGHIPFNEIALTAYNAGADYFCRVNDDTEFLSPNWITMGVQILLQQYDPPNIGVVGPLCKEGNIKILTHDMVHRTHIEIFGGYYYPSVFGNWYLDDWITNVYSTEVLGIDRSTVIQDWIVKHWIADTRYMIDINASAFLSNEYQIGLQSIYDYIVVNHSNYTSILAAMEEKILQTQQ